MMFVASLMMAIAVEHSGFHRRLSLNMIAAIGTSQRLIMLGRIFAANIVLNSKLSL